MLSHPKMKIVEDLVSNSSKEELIWLNGYLSGLMAETKTAPASLKTVGSKITITYGTETGNAKRLATDFAAKAKKNGLGVKVMSLDQYKLTELQKEEYFIGIISTHGDGEPPAGAKKFYEHIHTAGLKLQNIRYGIIALGDTAYPLFCKAGEDVDVQLAACGAQRIIPLQMCDTDYESEAHSWFSTVLNFVGNTTLPMPAPAPIKKSTGKQTYEGRVTANVNLNDRGSLKQTHHIEISAENVSYLPGDALGIVPQNPAALVASILEITGRDRNQLVSFKNDEKPLYDLLRRGVNIVCLPERVVKKYASLVDQNIPDTKIGLADLLKIYPLKEGEDFEKLISFLEPITPRLYSISSSPEAHEGEVHLTVARNQFVVNDETKYGLCSGHLCGFPVDEVFDFYIHSNDQFRLPAEDKDVIMIGPGTGIAPFRSFLAHRDTKGATGRNWLFFGDQQFATDFLYQTEIQNWFDTGVLSRINTAFSRDQQEKIYVQHKIKKEAKEFFNWIENGAHIYVCGTKEPMSVDVEKTIIDVIQEGGGFTESAAREYVHKLKEEERYLLDVY